jgi:hypothetical protein
MVPKRHHLILVLLSCGPVKDKGGTTTEEGSDTADPDTTGSDIPTSCDDALWVTTERLGRLTHVVLDSRLHSIAFGLDYTPVESVTNPFLVELDAEGVILRTATYHENSSSRWYGGVDSDDNVYAVFSPGGNSILRKFNSAGILVNEVALGAVGQLLYFAVAVDGSSVVTTEDFNNFGTVLTRVGSNFAVEWQISGDLLVQGVNSAGTAIAVRYPHDLALLDKGGNSIWERTLDVLDIWGADIDETGQIAAGGRTNDGKAFVSRFDFDGNLIWSTHFNALNQFDTVSDVELNAKGEVALSGTVQGSALQAYAAKFAANGEFETLHLCTVGKESQGLGMALDDEGRMRISGTFLFNEEYRAFVAAFD